MGRPDLVYELRDFGLQVVSWIWRDLHRTGVLRDRVVPAFARASRRPVGTTYVDAALAADGAESNQLMRS
jgi:hypothetical protein